MSIQVYSATDDKLVDVTQDRFDKTFHAARYGHKIKSIINKISSLNVHLNSDLIDELATRLGV